MNEDKNIIVGFDAKRVVRNGTGLGAYGRNLVNDLAALYPNAQLLLYAPDAGREDLARQVKSAPNLRMVYPKNAKNALKKAAWRSGGVVKDLLRDGVQVFHGLSGELPKGVKHAGIDAVVTIHDLIFMRYPKLYSFFDRKIHYRKFLYAAQHSEHIIAISEQTKQDIISYLGISEEKITVVYQGCHRAFKKIYTETQKETIRKKYHLPEKFVLNVGAIEPRKNALEIVKAIEPLRDISLVLVGKQTAYYQQIEAYCEAHQLKDRVQALSNVPMEDLAIIYQLAEVFCYPSIFEGFGIPIIEALFSKTPVISSQGSCFAEAGGTHSVYVNLQNAEKEIRKAIVSITTDEELRRQMVEEGYRHAQHFTDEAVFENLMKVYKKVKSE